MSRRISFSAGKLWFLECAVALTVCGCATMVGPETISDATEEFLVAESRPKVVALTPPVANMFVQQMFSDVSQADADVAREMELAAREYLVDMFSKKGYVIKAPTQEEASADPELVKLIEEADRIFAEELRRIVHRPKKVKLHAYSLGDTGRLLASRLAVDAVFLVRLKAQAITPDPLDVAGHLWLNIGVVDRDTGDIEAHYWATVGATGLKSFRTDPRGVVLVAVQELEQHFPAASGGD